MSGRVGKVQRELVTRYNRIANLYIAYTNSGAFADEFGREFFHAVGDILNGTPIDKLTLHHIDPSAFEEIVRRGDNKGGKSPAANNKKPVKKAKAPAKKKTKKPGKPKRKATTRRR